MKIHLEQVNDAYHFSARNESGNTISMDANPEIGGEGNGPRPMELVAMGMGGCTAIDVVSILKKQRQDLKRFEIEIEAERADTVPKVFTAIHIHYKLEGDLDPEKVRRAIELSKNKYCSASIMLGKTARITYSFSVNGESFA